MTKRTLKARLRLIKQSLELFERKVTLLRRTCAELGEELFEALDRCENRLFRDLPNPERLACACDACVKARLCMEVNGRLFEELLQEEQRLLEASGLVKAPPTVENRH